MLEHLDQQLFIFINSANSPFWDKVMYLISMRVVWVPLYAAILIYLGTRYKRRFGLIVLFIIIAVVLSDQSSVLVKNAIDRLRPCYEPSLQGLVHIVQGKCGGKFGFVSSHAANSFNAAILSLMLIKKKWYSICIIAWASIVSYSRIYLGVHYPGDVLCGAILGALIGWSVYKIYENTDRRILQNKYPPTPPKGG